MLQPTFNLPCSPDSLHVFYTITNNVISVAAIVLSAVVIHLSSRSHEMRVYAKLIVLTSSFNIIFSLTRILIAQRPITTTDYNYYFTTSFLLYHSSATLQHIGIVLNHLAVYVHVGMPVIQIYYRYKVLKDSDVSVIQLVAMLSIVVLFSLINAITFIPIFHINPSIFTEKIFGGVSECNQDTIPTFTVIDKRTILSELHNVFGHTGLFISYVIVVFYTYKTWRVYKCSSSRITKRKRQINRVVTIVFFLQIIPPFLFTVLPIIIFATHILPSALMAYISVVLGVGPALTPLFDSLTILFIIPSFRKRFLKIMQLSKRTVVSSTWSKNSVTTVKAVNKV